MAILADNKKALFNFEILERFTAGVELLGTEVKSVREGKMNLPGAFISVRVRWITTPDEAQHKFYLLAGGMSGATTLQSGFGFKAVGTTLRGVSISVGTQTEVSPLVTLTVNSWYSLLAVRRTTSIIDFYVNGALAGSINTATPTMIRNAKNTGATGGCWSPKAVMPWTSPFQSCVK